MLLQRLAITALMALATYYVWRRLVRDTGLPRPWRGVATAVIVALPLPLGVASYLSPPGPPMVQGLVAWPTFLAWALFGLTFAALLLVDLGRALVWIGRRAARRPAPVDLARRQLLARVTGGGAAVAVVTQVGVGLGSVLRGPTVVDVPIALPRWPAALDGFSIVQLTDLHIGMTVDRAYVADVVAKINAAAPDLIVLTGDMIDGSVADLRDASAPLAALRAPHGVYAVTGNHEYYSGADAWIARFAELGVRTLRNERVVIERAGAAFTLAGVDDHSARSFPGHGEDLPRALDGRDPASPVVLLAHQPRQVHRAAKHGVDLVLSGHTHGGQVWPWHYLVAAQQGGLLVGRYQMGDTLLYVSRGAGYWGPPVRVGAPAEISRILLRAA